MAENTIQRVIKVDTSASDKTVRELTAELENARKNLAELQAGAEGYAVAAQRAAAAEQELNKAMEISEKNSADMLATVQQLAEAEARSAEEVNKIIDAMIAYGDAGTNVSTSLGSVNEATENAIRTTQQLDEGVNALRKSGSDLIEMMVEDEKELKAIKQQRKELNEEIKKGIITEEQAREVKGELIAQEIVYKGRISESRITLAAMNKEVRAAEGSYDQMSQTLGRLRDAYRQLGESQRKSPHGEELLQQIQKLDGELKNIDASMGNFQRNVGNYQGAIDRLIPGFSNLTSVVRGLSDGTMTFSGVASGAANAIKGITTEALAFIATPIGAFIAGLVVVYQGLKSSIDDLNDAIEGNVELQKLQSIEQAKVSAWQTASKVANEENAKSWIKLKGAISEAWEIYKIVVKDLIKSDWVHLWKTATGVTQIKAAQVEAAKLKIQLHELQVGDPDEGRLGSIEKRAKIEAEIANLRAVATDQENHSDKEREEALRSALEKNKELYAIQRQELDLKLKIAQAEHEGSPDNAAFQQEWANLRAQREQLNAQEANSERMLIRSLNKFTVDDTAEAAKKAAKEREKAAKETAEATERIRQQTLRNNQEARAKTEENEIKTANENYQQDLANFNKIVKEKKISEEVAAEYRKSLAEKTEAEIAEIREKWRIKNEEEAKKAKQKEEAETKATYKSSDEDLQRNASRETAEAKRDIKDPQELEQELSNIQQRLYEARVALIDETLQGIDESSNLFKELSNERADLEIKNINRIADEEKKAAEEKKKRDKLTKETALNIASSTLNSLSSIIGEETAAGKAAAVAAAVIDTYKAANGAYASLSSIPYVGPALGAAAAAAAVVSGIANVKKILSTKEDGSNAASVAATPVSTPNIPAVVTPPAVVEQVPLTRTLTSASEEERLNQMASPQRVFVVYDDIAQAGRNVQVQQTESTF